MPAVKRAANAQAKSSKSKKAKVASPLEKNFATVLDALTNENTVVPGPESCRSMFVAVADAALKTPKDERHSDQITMITMMREVFVQEKARWEARVAEASAAVEAAKTLHTDKIAAKDVADAELKAKKQEVATKLEAQTIAMEVVRECEGELQKAKDMHSSADAARNDISKEREEVLSVQEMMKALGDGSVECPKELKKNLATVTSLFKNMGVEEALLKTIPQVLGRKPSDRGNFDLITLQQLDSVLQEHISQLDGKIEAAATDVTDHVTATTAWGAAVELSLEKKCGSDVAVETAQQEQCNLEATLASARKVVREHATVVKHRSSDLATEEVGLNGVEEVIQALDFLEEYTVPAPEEEPIEEATIEQAEMTKDEVEGPPVISAKLKEISVGMDVPDVSEVPSPTKQGRSPGAQFVSNDVAMAF